VNLDRTASLKSGDLSPEPVCRALVPDTFRELEQLPAMLSQLPPNAGVRGPTPHDTDRTP